MGDPRRPAWMCSPTSRPWGFSGNFTAQQQSASNVFVVSWMSGWGMNRWICKTTWEKKKQKLQLLSQSPDRLVYPRFFFLPSISLPSQSLERCSKCHRCLKRPATDTVFILSRIHRSGGTYLSRREPIGTSIQNLNTCYYNETDSEIWNCSVSTFDLTLFLLVTMKNLI